MTPSVAGADPARHRSHRLHDAGRIWPETNCYVDLWIELLAARGHDPDAMLGFTVAVDFEADQATFFKPPTADLTALYGLDIQELAVFDRLEAHVLAQIGRGRLVMVEVDAFHLPDTAGLTYRTAHAKTTVGIDAFDPAARRMAYFHNAGCFALDGDDYDAIFRPAPGDGPGLPLFPYAEFVRFDVAVPAGDPRAVARELLRGHLARRPADNPFRAWGRALPEIAADLAGRPPAYFHTYAFGTPRQFGAAFELLADHLLWLATPAAALCAGALEAAAADARAIAEAMKVFQFKLARAMARGRFDGVADPVAAAAARWDGLVGRLDDAFAGPRRAVAV
jgi:hypothetical protein